MYRLLPILCALLVAPSWAGAQSLPRVGDSIDEAERTYFGFFRDIEGITGVEVEEDPGGDLRFRIQRAQGDTMYVLAAARRGTLEAYLIHHETQSAIEALDFEDLQGIVRYRSWFQDGMRVQVVRMDGERIEGMLLRVDPERLILLVGTDQYRWDTVSEHVRVIRTDEIATINTPFSRAQSRLGIGLSTLAVGLANSTMMAGAYLRADEQPVQSAPLIANSVLSVVSTLGSGIARAPRGTLIYGRPEKFALLEVLLRENVAFAREIPAELLNLQTPAPDPAQPSLQDYRDRAQRKRLSLSLGGTYLFGSTGTMSGFYATGQARVPVGPTRIPSSAWYADARFAVLPRVRIGATVLLAPQPEAAAWEGYSWGSTVTAYGEFVLKQHDPLFLTQAGRLEASVSGGVNRSTLKTGIDYAFSPAILGLDPSLEPTSSRSETRTGLGVFGRASLAYYFSPSLSLEAALSYRNHQAVALERDERSYQFGTSSGLLYQLEAFATTFPPIDVFVGTRWHF